MTSIFLFEILNCSATHRLLDLLVKLHSDFGCNNFEVLWVLKLPQAFWYGPRARGTCLLPHLTLCLCYHEVLAEVLCMSYFESIATNL